MTVLKRKSSPQTGDSDTINDDQSGDVFGQVIDAAKRNGMSLETWLQVAVRQDENRDHLSPDEKTLKKLLQTQRHSRLEAERAAFVAEEALQDELEEPDTDADSEALISAIDDLSTQLNFLKTPEEPNTEDNPQLPAAEGAAEDDEVYRMQGGGSTIEDLRARILALKQRIVSPVEPLEDAETELESNNAAPEIIFDLDLDASPGRTTRPDSVTEYDAGDESFDQSHDQSLWDTSFAQQPATGGSPTPDAILEEAETAPEDGEKEEALSSEVMESHFKLLGDKINSLLEKSDSEAKTHNDDIREKLEHNLSLLESKISQLPTRDDVAILRPMAKMQVKLQEDQGRLDQNLQKLADEHVRLHNSVTQSDAGRQLPALQSQIDNLEASVKSIKPALSRDVAGLLDLTVQKLEKSIRQQPDAVTNSALQTQIAKLEKTLQNLPSEIAQQQPNPQSLISFLPPRETLESIEHTVGRLEAILMEQQTSLNALKAGDQTHLFKDRFDSLLARLDDTMKRFDSASLEADRRAGESTEQQTFQNQNFVEQLSLQIESLERRIEEIPALGAAKIDETDATHQQMQDDLARIETQMSTVMAQLEKQLARPDPKIPAAPTATEVSKAVSDAVVTPLHEALNRVERGIDARSQQTLDDLSALLKANAEKSKSPEGLDKRLSSVPDTLSLLLNKIYDLESGVDRLQAKRSKQAVAHSVAAKDTQTRSRIRKAEIVPDRTDRTGRTDQSGDTPPQPSKPALETTRETARPSESVEAVEPVQQAAASGTARGSRSAKSEQTAEPGVGMNYIAAARRATHKRAERPAIPAEAASTEDPSVDSIKRRAEHFLAQQKQELQTESDPSRRKKILGVCLGLSLIIAAVALTLQSYRSQSGPEEVLTTGSISGPAKAARASLAAASKVIDDPSDTAARPVRQKIPDRLPGGTDRFSALGENIFGALTKPTNIALPVAKPDSAKTATDTPLLHTFVAPAPASTIGPLPLRYKAAIGDAVAQFEVGSRYADGFGTPADMQKAVQWYRRAADQGLAPALYRLGSLLEHGRGITKDKAAAAELYEQAGDKGNTKAMYNLGVLHAQGALGEPDFAAAAEWFTRAAEAGVRDSQFNLAILHARGMGVATDLEEAYFWFAVAAKDGDPDAIAKRDALGPDLLSDIRAQLDRKVAGWVPELPPENANNVAIPDEGWIAVELPASAEAVLAKHAETASDGETASVGGLPTFFEQSGVLDGKPLTNIDESRI
uniref:hypothetical protein n=1 Tax=Pararhizobium sp. IMCC3301 TaxID=3067904 RepID=UPI0027411975|nr:hypothetical protein [Pararhizobium sp. IMCC3301]